MPGVADHKQSDHAVCAKPLNIRRLVLRCIVFEDKPGQFTAECIDLGLMVRGKTLDAAGLSLQSAVKGYIQVALAGDPTGLIPRPSPISHHLRYHFYALRAKLSFRTSGTKRKYRLENCPVPC